MNQNLIRLAIDNVMPTARATGLFVSLATFSEPTGATVANPAGELDDEGFPLSTYTNIVGLVDIPCMLPPMNTGDSVSADKAKGQEQNMLNAPKHLLLDDYYPTVVNGWREGWRVTVDGVVFDLLGAESDSQRQMVRCYVREVSY